MEAQRKRKQTDISSFITKQSSQLKILSSLFFLFFRPSLSPSLSLSVFVCVCNSHDGNDICSSKFNGQGFTHVSVCATVVIVQYNRETRILPSAI